VGESAIARSISCELRPGDVKLPELTAVQQRASELNECMSEYIQYVIANWDTISEKLKPLFLELRDKAQIGGHGRLAVAVAHLQIGLTVMCDWLESVNVLLNRVTHSKRSRGIFSLHCPQSRIAVFTRKSL